MPLLIVTCDESKLSRRYQVTGERFTIGRSRTCEVSIHDRSISKVHVVLQRTASGHTFQDLWSQNGTFLNGERRDAGTIKNGDILRLGRVQIAFQGDGEAPPPALPLASDAPPRRRAGTAPAGGRERVSERAARRALFFVAICVVGILAGIFIGRGWRGSPTSPAPDTLDPPSAATTVAQVPDLEGAAVLQPEVDEEARKVEASWIAGLDRPYADGEESARVLFRLFLDLQGRPPTRTEAGQLLPRKHGERWRRLRAMPGAPRAGEAVTATFKRFLDRQPTNAERRAASKRGSSGAGEATLPGASPAPDLGLLLTASDEYRSPDLRRQRTLRQRAASLVVDFLDRPPAGEEVLEVEEVLGEYPRGSSVARVIAFSEEAGRALGVPAPDLPLAGEDARRWIAREFHRFLLRSPAESELEAVTAELSASVEAARWVRLALAGAERYRSY